jgi:hypothetical protein
MLTVKDTDVPGTCPVTFKFTDAKGKPAKVDGIPTLTAEDPTIVDSTGTVVQNSDGSFSATLHITDTVGSSQLDVVADVDLGSGVDNVTFTDVVNVIAGDAVAMNMTFGAVTPDGATGGTGSTGATGP